MKKEEKIIEAKIEKENKKIETKTIVIIILSITL